MDRLSAADWQPDFRAPEHYRVVYVQSHVRTRQWFKKGETFVWSDGEENNRAVYRALRKRFGA